MKECTEKKRNPTIDLLRVIGLVLVISAHCGFSSWFTNARDFDVILLMFLSGISFALSFQPADSYFHYVKKRFFRLVVPVWVFLIFFFLFFRLLGRTFSLSVMAQSFLLLSGGILFVWVYRVFFTTALLNPFLRRLDEKAGKAVFVILPAVLLANDLLHELVFSKAGTAGKILEYLFTYTIAYGMVSLAGMAFSRLEEKGRIFLGAESLILFLIAGLILKFPDFYSVKYPPRLYYCFYGLFWSVLLYLLTDSLHLRSLPSSITWLSVHTMDIFMWHIFAFYLLDTLKPELLDHPWLDLFAFLGIGVLGAFLQDFCRKAMKRRNA